MTLSKTYRALAWLLAVTAVVPPLQTYAQEGQAAVRRIYVPYFPSTIAWEQTAIAWFGHTDLPGGPGSNYADVRVAYTAQELAIHLNIEDYYIWYDTAATSTSDLTGYDAVAVYLDVAHDRSSAPGNDDYLLISGLCHSGCGDGSRYRRDGRGTGAAWDLGWQSTWSASTGASWWCNPGPNSNTCGFDYGWTAVIHIPWSAVGLTSPPPTGAVWGFAIALYDRDDLPPAGAVPPENWPDTFQSGVPSTWGELAFGLAGVYASPSAPADGLTVIRRGLNRSTVADAWVGGGGACLGGHQGDPDHDTHGDDTSLYVASQTVISDFPCYSKTFLRFGLEGVPAGRTILSATLTMYQWDNANWEEAQPSLIWLLTSDGDWSEDSITWNSAPPARANLSSTWVGVVTPENNPGWPGVAYEWDATRAVAGAYAARVPVNLALYSADTHFHSSKYFVSSETGDWNGVARPTLTVWWATPAPTLAIWTGGGAVRLGQVMTYTVVMTGADTELYLSDTVPDGVSFVSSSLSGGAQYDALQGAVRWKGLVDAGQTVSLTYQVTVTTAMPQAIVNTAVLTDAAHGPIAATAMVIANPGRCYLPLVRRGSG